ncbi:M61 family metallopeptidase [Paralysiella testudinis]|uniref:M61 family metallopeptidase n=1 Tax=Paralysiella testudinis TaxID=2809020 RepID=A0A892ZG65_9NEIS|nr:M61 family peptidase [Paralysiella testudinis]QRQ81932.1 M61 family metallopeptidase [Paralysiella testudinis]
MLHYHISPYSLEQHLWQVRLCFRQTDTETISFSLPNWVPGSYMIREFARHIVAIEARGNGRPAQLTQNDKNTWQLTATPGEWTIEYRVYAFDLSVRGAWLTRERGFFDGACVFLRHHQRQHEPCTLHIDNLPGDWDIATSMNTGDAKYTFQAASYADLIDHPVETGTLMRLPFSAGGIEHEIVISGHSGGFDAARLQHDVAKICAAQLAFFPAPAPFQRYVFLLHVGDNIYGGLEHRSSTALLADRHSLPRANGSSDAYIGLLGLFSHEYFHAWNIKSIKPQAFAESDLNHEAYSEQLWAFEGITSYYDDLFLVRSGVISATQYLRLLAQNLTRVQQSGGRQVQTLAEASFNAWTKYYKQNENSPNALVSYYQQGALMALCLDSHIRQHSGGRHSLDSIMQALYADYTANGQALAEGEWQQRAQTLSGIDLADFFQAALYTTAPLPLAKSLQHLGVDLQWQALPRSHGGDVVDTWPPEPAASTDFGARFSPHPYGIKLTHVLNGGSAEAAGLCAGDEIIALNQLACRDFAAAWARLAVGERISVHYFRHGLLQQTMLTVQAADTDTALLRIRDADTLQHWLNPTTP